MEEVFLLLGSNLGNRLLQLSLACEALSTNEVQMVRKSGVYETAPWGFTEQPAFLNQVVEIRTALSPEQLLRHCMAAEVQLGRIRNQAWGPRMIDIDILYFGQQTQSLPHLHIPHPGIPQRAFCLVPMVELASDFLHPVLGITQLELLKKCTDALPVTLLQNLNQI